MRSSFEIILEQFRTYFPDLYDKGTDWWKSGPYHITVVLNDGDRVEFDASENTIRWLREINRSLNNEDFRKEIGRNIRKFIVYRGMRQQDVSEQIGVTDAMLSRYINGTSMPGLDKLYKLANVLNCNITDLTGVDE